MAEYSNCTFVYAVTASRASKARLLSWLRKWDASLRKRTTNCGAITFADGVNERSFAATLHKRIHPKSVKWNEIK